MQRGQRGQRHEMLFCFSFSLAVPLPLAEITREQLASVMEVSSADFRFDGGSNRAVWRKYLFSDGGNYKCHFMSQLVTRWSQVGRKYRATWRWRLHVCWLLQHSASVCLTVCVFGSSMHPRVKANVSLVRRVYSANLIAENKGHKSRETSDFATTWVAYAVIIITVPIFVQSHYHLCLSSKMGKTLATQVY